MIASNMSIADPIYRLTCFLWVTIAEQTIIVWDLETIPDLAAAARMLDMSLATEGEVREALGGSFPKHPLHEIVV